MNRIWLTAGAALVVVGAAVAGATDARAGHRSGSDPNADLVVTLVTPTTNQEVLPDLSDPGLNNVITVRFSAPLRAKDFISNSNVFNRLTPAVEFLSSSFDRLPGTPIVQGNVFRFDPRTPANFGVLPNGQYTLHIKSSVRSRRGKLLYAGVRDFTTTFTVGTDVYPPVLRRISPVNNQTNIGLNQKVIVSFNEPISVSSLTTTITVQDAGTNPPTPILGANGTTGVTLERNGFDIVFTPDPCFGYPPKSIIEFVMQGRPIGDPTSPIVACQPGNIPSVTAVEDAFTNQFTRDAGLHWSKDPATGLWISPNGSWEDCTGQFKMQFQTRGITPPPVGLVPGSSQFVAGLCPANTVYSNGRCAFQGRVFFYTTGTSLGELDITSVVSLFLSTGKLQYDLVRIVPNSPVRMGRPGGLMVDPRWDANNNNHTFIYLVDQRSASVLILDSRSLKVLGRFTGFSAPRDLAIAGQTGGAILYVTDFGARQVVGIDLSSISVNLGGQPGAQSPCDAIQDNVKSRFFIPVGNGPSGIAADSYLQRRVIAVNTLDNSITLIDARSNKVLKDYQVGGNPLDVDFTLLGFGAIDAAAISNQGGLTDPDGSVSLYLRAPPLTNYLPGAAQNRDGIEFTLTENVKNPTYIWGNQEWANPFTGNSVPQQFFIPNTGSKTIINTTIRVTGVFGLLIDLQTQLVREVGFNPTSCMLDPFYPNLDLYACVAGEGRFVGMDAAVAKPAQGITVPGIRRIFTCYSH